MLKIESDPLQALKQNWISIIGGALLISACTVEIGPPNQATTKNNLNTQTPTTIISKTTTPLIKIENNPTPTTEALSTESIPLAELPLAKSYGCDPTQHESTYERRSISPTQKEPWRSSARSYECFRFVYNRRNMEIREFRNGLSGRIDIYDPYEAKALRQFTTNIMNYEKNELEFVEKQFLERIISSLPKEVLDHPSSRPNSEFDPSNELCDETKVEDNIVFHRRNDQAGKPIRAISQSFKCFGLTFDLFTNSLSKVIANRVYRIDKRDEYQREAEREFVTLILNSVPEELDEIQNAELANEINSINSYIPAE